MYIGTYAYVIWQGVYPSTNFQLPRPRIVYVCNIPDSHGSCNIYSDREQDCAVIASRSNHHPKNVFPGQNSKVPFTFTIEAR